MVRVQSSIYLDAQEEVIASVAASIAAVSGRRSSFRFIGRYQKLTNPLMFHQKNIDVIKRMATELKMPSLAQFAREFQAILNSKK